MLLIILTAIVLIISLLFTLLFLPDITYLGLFLSVVSGMILAIEVLILIIVYAGNESYIIRCDERQKAIQHEIDAISIETDDYTKTKAIEDIDRWNEDLLSGRYWCQNIWVGVYWPKDLYYRYEAFEYPNFDPQK